MINDPTDQLSRRLRAERETRGWTVAELAERSGVSRAMISKVERAEASPTAALLGRLSGAFGLTLSTLLARAEGSDGSRLLRARQQPLWQDPKTGYLRRTLSPATGGPLELVRIELPAGGRVAYPAAAFAFLRQQIWVISGTLTFTEGEIEHWLEAGDCLELGPPADCEFHNREGDPCIYLVALVRR